jgi:omega-6 fatty acid desaturase (delta-12 desaturase)
MSPRVPNYFLQKCHESQPRFRAIRPVTFVASLKSLTFRLWDEQRKMYVGYRLSTMQ